MTVDDTEGQILYQPLTSWDKAFIFLIAKLIFLIPTPHFRHEYDLGCRKDVKNLQLSPAFL